MSTHAVMPLTDYVDTCDAIREKTGSTDAIKSDELPERVSDVFKAGQLDIVSNAEALKGSASGTDIIAITDISPVEHDVPCKVENKNLFDEQLEIGGINTKTGENDDKVSTTLRAKNYIKVLPSTSYFFTCPTGLCATGGLMQIYRYDENKNFLGYGSTGIENQKYITGADWYYIRFVIRAEYGTVYNNDIQIEKGSTATEYTPYVTDLSSVEVSRYGKNLCDGQLQVWAGTDRIMPKNAIRVKRNTYYTISVVGATTTPTFAIHGNNTGFIKVYEDKQFAWDTTTFNSGEYDYIWFRPVSENSYYGIDFDSKVQVEQGETITEYEPYIEPTVYTANADGTVEGIKSLYPNMTLISDTKGVIITANYIKDIDKAFEERLAELEAAIVNN